MEASAMQMITSSSLSSFSQDRSKTFAFVQTSWFRTDLISRVYMFVFRIFPHTGNRTKWRQFSCTCAKATGTESLHPTLQRVADEGGREGGRGNFMKSQLALRRSAMASEMWGLCEYLKTLSTESSLLTVQKLLGQLHVRLITTCIIH